MLTHTSQLDGRRILKPETIDLHGRGAHTLAWAGIFNTFFWIDREKKVCAVLMSQMSPGLDEGPRSLLEDFDKAVYNWLQEAVGHRA